MNNFSKLAVVTAALALVAQGARAALPNEDLVLGFIDPTATDDYTINLGQASGLISTPGATHTLAVNASTFNTAFGTAVNNVSAGVVGGSVLSSGTVYMTTVRSGAVDNTAGAGSLDPNATSGGGLGATSGKAIGTHALGVTIGTPVNTATTSWSQNVVAYGQTQASFSPQTALSSGGAVYEDLWGSPNAGDGNGNLTWTYLGYFTFNFSNESSPVATFTAVAVPEPATYGCLAGAGLLLVALRRQLGQKTA